MCMHESVYVCVCFRVGEEEEKKGGVGFVCVSVSVCTRNNNKN